MPEGHPYRPIVSPSYEEEELWFALDAAIEGALTDPGMASLMIGWIVQDAIRLRYPELQSAAEGALHVLFSP